MNDWDDDFDRLCIACDDKEAEIGGYCLECHNHYFKKKQSTGTK